MNIRDGYQTTLGAYFSIQSNSINTDTEWAIENVHINWVKFRENVMGFLSPGTKKTVRNSEMSVFIGCLLGLTVFSWRRYKDDLLINCGLKHVVCRVAFLPINSLHD